MARIFISYRRQDSPSMTGRIYDQLEAVFGSDRVFRDIDDIGAGQDFRARIAQEVDKSDVLLVIIGPKWENITDDQGKRRLANPNDFVRLEVEEGLKNPKKIVIPVLVENTPMPAPKALPASMQELCYRNAVSVRQDPDFHPDMQKLVDQIRKIGRKGPSLKKPVMIGAGLLGIGVIAVLAASLFIPGAVPAPVTVTPTLPDTTISPTSTSSLTPTLTPTFTNLPPAAITDTKTATVTATNTPTPSNAIRIGVIKIPDSIFNDTVKRLSNLGFDAEWLNVSAGYENFVNYDVIYLPIGWSGQDELIEGKSGQYQRFVKEGGGLVVEQPNSNATLAPKLLPYKIVFSPMRYNANEWPANILLKHDIVNNLRTSELPGPGDKLAPKDDHWLALAASAKTHTPTLVIATYGEGRIVVMASAISKNSKVEYQVGDHFIERLIVWVSSIEAP